MRATRLILAGIDVTAIRVSFTGDLGWELHCRAEDQVALYAALLAAGREIGAGPVGSRALGSLRIEKGYGSWGREYSPEYWPHESGLERLIRPEKDFLNKVAWAEIANKPPRDQIVFLEIDATVADATGGEPIFLRDGTPIGQVSSGAYGYSVGKSLAIGYVKAQYLAPELEVDVAIIGRPHKARIMAAPAFDPDGQRLRG
jgi:dimethylglycine dehydrogenase